MLIRISGINLCLEAKCTFCAFSVYIYTFLCREQCYSCSLDLSFSVSLLPAVFTLSVLHVSVNCCILLTGSDYCDSCRVQLAWRFRVRQCISLNVIREPSYSRWFRGFAFVIEWGPPLYRNWLTYFDSNYICKRLVRLRDCISFSLNTF